MGKDGAAPVGYCPHCNKIAHRDREGALAARRNLIKAGKHATRQGRLKTYQCPYGYGFHVGHDGRQHYTKGRTDAHHHSEPRQAQASPGATA